VLGFDSGIQSTASGKQDAPNHVVMQGEFFGTLRTQGSSAPGYLSFTWEFPEPVVAFGADFFSIGGSRDVSVQGTFDGGGEAFVPRDLFTGDGGVDQGFFGFTSATPFESITLVALGSIDSNDAMQFSKDQLTVDASCTEVELTLTHSGTIAREAMGHNWVLTRAEDAMAVNQDGMQAGLESEYVKPDDERVIARTPVIGGGGETTITFSIQGLNPDGDYKFFCSFPGHFVIMQGEFRIVANG